MTGLWNGERFPDWRAAISRLAVAAACFCGCGAAGCMSLVAGRAGGRYVAEGTRAQDGPAALPLPADAPRLFLFGRIGSPSRSSRRTTLSAVSRQPAPLTGSRSVTEPSSGGRTVMVLPDVDPFEAPSMKPRVRAMVIIVLVMLFLAGPGVWTWRRRGAHAAGRRATIIVEPSRSGQ